MNMSDAQPSGAEPKEPVDAALDLLHRTNNFLTLCLTESEMALESEDPEELLRALRAIRGGAEAMAGHSREAREDLLDEPPGHVRRSA